MRRTRADERGWNMCPIGLPVGIGAVYHVPLFFPLLLHDTKKRDREVGSRAHPRARLLATTQEKCRKDRKEEKKCLKKRAQQRGASDTVRSPPRSRNLPAGQCIFGAALPSFLLRVLVIHCLGSRHAMAVPRLIGEKKGNPRRGPRGGGEERHQAPLFRKEKKRKASRKKGPTSEPAVRTRDEFARWRKKESDEIVKAGQIETATQGTGDLLLPA